MGLKHRNSNDSTWPKGLQVAKYLYSQILKSTCFQVCFQPLGNVFRGLPDNLFPWQNKKFMHPMTKMILSPEALSPQFFLVP